MPSKVGGKNTNIFATILQKALAIFSGDRDAFIFLDFLGFPAGFLP